MIKYLAGAALAALLVVPLAGEAQAAGFGGGIGPSVRGGGGGGGGSITTNRGGGGGGFRGNAVTGNRGGFNNGTGNRGGFNRNFSGGNRGGYRGRGYGGYRGYRGRSSIYVVPGYYPGFYDPFYPYGYGYGYGFGYNSYYPYDYPDYAYVPPPDRGPESYDDYLPPPGEMGPPPAQNWYYCDDPQGYYPYVRSCSHDWQAVPATPPGATGQQGANAPRELPAPPDDRTSLDDGRN